MASQREWTSLEEQYHHVALPRNVPGRESKRLFEVEAALLDRFIAAVKFLTPLVPLEQQATVDAVRLALSTSKSLNVEGKVDKTLLTKAIVELSGNQALFLHVTEQNAALLLYKLNSSDLIIEAFETSATSESVCAAEQALQWDFPGQAVSIPPKVYTDENFLKYFAAFLEQSSIESVKEFSAVTRKAEESIPEIRDTTDPALITGLLMAILGSLGQVYPVHTIRKRVRDTVSFKEAHKPWRRSPFYLVIRVTVQRHLCQLLGVECGRLYYKIIICVFLSLLMDASHHVLRHEDVYFLKQKLGKRLAKVEAEYQTMPQSFVTLHDPLFRRLQATFENSLTNVGNHLDRQWEYFKIRTQRVVRPLPFYATEGQKNVGLLLSWPHLTQLLSKPFGAEHPPLHDPLQLIRQYEHTIANAKAFRKTTDRCISIARFEWTKLWPDKASFQNNSAGYCRELARHIDSYIDKVGGEYDGYSDLKSMFILNIMELWVEMDRQAVECFPLLEKYHPAIQPGILDDLELLYKEDLKRVQRIQTYLKKRCLQWAERSSKTIFESPAEDTFAVAYFDDSVELQVLRHQIQQDTKRSLEQKEEEWRELSEKHELLMRRVAESKCAYHEIVTREGAVIREHIKGCQKHRYKWEAKQVKIKIFENPLPESEAAAKTVIFELRCPKTLAAYRDATWSILATFAFRGMEGIKSVSLLNEYSGLLNYATENHSQVTLGSSTKSHLNSHYSETGFPVALHHVCRPCGLKFDYFDRNSQTWTKRQDAQSLSWHFPINLPADSPYRVLQINNADWPSSNEILSSQTLCPPDLNIHEFMAWQNLLSGTYSRWLCLLRELGATNLNFSSESSWVIITKLLLQAGPSHAESSLRDIHFVFTDSTFCLKLLEQANYRIMSLQCNWREHVQMDVMISILLKTLSLSSSDKIRDRTRRLLSKCREATWKWCVTLQSHEINSSKETAVCAVWAAVLHKRTFHAFEDLALEMKSSSLEHFVNASIILQENLSGFSNAMTHSLCSLLLRDVAFTYKNRHVLRNAILMDRKSFLSALERVWPVPLESLVEPPRVEALSEGWWVQVSMKSRRGNINHCVHYGILHGDLLINGKQSGTLPPQYRQSPIINKIFGTRMLRVRPSFEPGMSLYIDISVPNKHRIHLGFREGQLVIRATQHGATLELIDPAHFSNSKQYDLPSPLLDNCWHWLNLQTGIMEIRQDNIWRSKEGNWKLDVKKRSVWRRESRLIDPHCPLAAQIAQNFQFFESAKNIIVYQPESRSFRSRPSHITVELKRLELTFHVNKAKMLECRQLKAEIVPSHMQDAGVWYGLKSKIVLRSVVNPRQRIILIPTGLPEFKQDAGHVVSVIENDGSYLKYDVNPVLGRLDCPAEPRLLYTKAFWHAHTSHFLPDPLTGRTGKEEALDFLQSGICMPWTYLNDAQLSLLIGIANLTPAHAYYPPDRKSMVSTFWNPHLTITMQDDRYRAVVEKLYQRSEDLHLFETSLNKSQSPHYPPGHPHLERRSSARSHLAASLRRAHVYYARDIPKNNIEREKAKEISELLANWSSVIPFTSDLPARLQKYPEIGGCHGEFDCVRLSDRIAANLGQNWGSLVYSASHASIEDRYRLMFTFVPISFSATADIGVLRSLVSYALLPELKAIAHPAYPSFSKFLPGQEPSIKEMVVSMKTARQPYIQISQEEGQRHQVGTLVLKRIEHEKQSVQACADLAASILTMWPLVELDLNSLSRGDGNLINTEQALKIVLEEYTRLAQNFAFFQYLLKVQNVMEEHDVKRTTDGSVCVEQPTPSLPRLLSPYTTQTIMHDRPTLRDLLRGTKTQETFSISEATQSFGTLKDRTNSVGIHAGESAIKSSTMNSSKQDGRKLLGKESSEIKTLRQIVKRLRTSASPIQDQYGAELEQSINSLVKFNRQPQPEIEAFNASELKEKIHKVEMECNIRFYKLGEALEADDRRTKWLKHAGLWPRVTKLLLLAELNSKMEGNLEKHVIDTLVTFGMQVTVLQRLLRIEDAALKGKYQQLHDEQANLGHSNWLPIERPDWLLLEIDNNIMLRAEQIDVANATIAPSSGQNSVVQLLMGKGKTSCILPMVAAVLADKSSLLRIIVPRALLLQSAQVMQIKLGALLNREIMHVPFSRKTPTDCQLMEKYFRMHINLSKSCGVVIALPEHILSYKLSGLQRLCDNRLCEGSKMIKFESWLNQYARDVLDECDVSLAVRTQLIYPSGSLMTVDGHPLRWQTIQAVLRLVQLYLPTLEDKFPESIEVVQRSQEGYPLVYFLREDVQTYLMGRLVRDICDGQVTFLPCTDISSSEKKDIEEFISSATVTSHVLKRVKGMFRDKQHLLNVLYHLRGLLVHRILLSSMKKRWNVQYGLHPTREPIAVPYHAKGVPSPSSEWGHPDVAITLTCLSFYYQGLGLQQFKQSCEQLLKSDEPSIEYEKWITKHLPSSLRDFNSINVEDIPQLAEIHQHVRFNIHVIDFYLNHFVFPKHAKQFTVKLQASGWDLILTDHNAISKCKTTGFSGTNDSRHQLPMTIMQNDELKNLSHTNAEVLSYLLAPRNRRYVLTVDKRGRLSETDLLRKLLNPLESFNPDKKERIRVLIDAGAQILEHSNIDLAIEWLNIDTEASAAVYFDDSHKPWVRYRKGKCLPLVATPFAENLEECLVYLDESHCRGTDLKLPVSARAALTLGPHVTKDALAQAAMRLRLLGQTQAVTFFAPPEVHQGILDMLSSVENPNRQIMVDSRHVIAWLLKQSCHAIEQLEPLHCTQGNDYLQRVQAKLDNPGYFEVANAYERSRLLSIMQSKELQTLKELYEPKRLNGVTANDATKFHASLKNFTVALKHRKQNFLDRGVAVHSSALEEVEQEREVEQEVESVREIQIPIHFMPHKIFRLHKDVKEFSLTGRLASQSEAYQSMLSFLQKTAVGSRYHGTFNIHSERSILFVSKQYTRTVKTGEPNDNFLRPCQWLLLSPETGIALAVSPEEADELLQFLRGNWFSKTHLIVYSAPVTRRMLHFNNLSYHATPPLPRNFTPSNMLKAQLGIFAGRLYFDWTEHEDLCNYLGITRTVEETVTEHSSFTAKPLTFLHEWLAVLRKGQDFEHTPMGFLTTGKPLSANLPFFRSIDHEDFAAHVPTTDNRLASEENEESDDDDSDDDDMYQQDHDSREIDPEDEKSSDFDEEKNDFFDAKESFEEENADEEDGDKE